MVHSSQPFLYSPSLSPPLNIVPGRLLNLGPNFISRHSSREGQVLSPSFPQERAKFYLPAFLERGPSFISQLSSRGGQVLSPGFHKTGFWNINPWIMGLISTPNYKHVSKEWPNMIKNCRQRCGPFK
jgi:hypothetical protein